MPRALKNCAIFNGWDELVFSELNQRPNLFLFCFCGLVNPTPQPPGPTPSPRVHTRPRLLIPHLENGTHCPCLCHGRVVIIFF